MFLLIFHGMKVKWLSIEDEWHFWSNDTVFSFLQLLFEMQYIFHRIVLRLLLRPLEIHFLVGFYVFHLDPASSLWKLCQIEICEFLNCFFLFLIPNFLSIVLAMTKHMAGWFCSWGNVAHAGYIAVGVGG